MKSFTKRQRQQIYEFGLISYILRKLSFCSFYIALLPLFPLYLIIRALRPLILIRFGFLNDLVIGHFVANTELYLCEKDHGIQPSNSLDIFYHSGHACNQQLLKMWNRVLHVKRIGAYFDKINNICPGGDVHKITTTCSDRDVFGLMEKSRIHLSFTLDEKRRAESGLRKMGVGEGKTYICVKNRDAAYRDKVSPFRDWSYHNYRNDNIQNFVLASREFSRRGYHVIRVGAEVNEIMQVDDPKIIEYAHGGFRTELLDIYLPAHCYFIITTSSGTDAVTRAFRRPLVYVNFVPFEYLPSWDSKAITIFKKFWLKKKKRFMTFREILESGAGRYLRTHSYEDHGIELVENTPEEICDAAIEMDERLKGTWEPTEEDEELQKYFWSLFKPSNINKVFRSRICAKYLRQNRELLEM